MLNGLAVQLQKVLVFFTQILIIHRVWQLDRALTRRHVLDLGQKCFLVFQLTPDLLLPLESKQTGLASDTFLHDRLPMELFFDAGLNLATDISLHVDLLNFMQLCLSD